MIPAKEKARELYNKFFITTPQPYTEKESCGLKFRDWDKDWTYEMARKQALIAVDVILDARPGCPYPQEVGVEVQGIFAAIEYPTVYWREVRKEIENYEVSR